MTVYDLIAFALLAFFCAFHGLHAWVQIRRQQEQIERLQRLAAARAIDDDSGLLGLMTNDQRLEDLARQNQPARQKGPKSMLPIS